MLFSSSLCWFNVGVDVGIEGWSQYVVSISVIMVSGMLISSMFCYEFYFISSLFRVGDSVGISSVIVMMWVVRCV